MNTKDKTLIAIACSLCVLACGKKMGDAAADAVVDVLLPGDVTPCELPAIETPSEGTPICADVTQP